MDNELGLQINKFRFKLFERAERVDARETCLLAIYPFIDIDFANLESSIIIVVSSHPQTSDKLR